MWNGLPIEMSKEQVNAALGHAAVGLVLGEVEGARCAAIESRLAALPVVASVRGAFTATRQAARGA